jgi:hypothetical protein
MGDATGEGDREGLRLDFDRRLKLEFHGATRRPPALQESLVARPLDGVSSRETGWARSIWEMSAKMTHYRHRRVLVVAPGSWGAGCPTWGRPGGEGRRGCPLWRFSPCGTGSSQLTHGKPPSVLR